MAVRPPTPAVPPRTGPALAPTDAPAALLAAATRGAATSTAPPDMGTSKVARVRNGVVFAAGFAAQAVNELVARAIPSSFRGANIIVLQGDGPAARGASMLSKRLSRPPCQVDYDALRGQRQLLASTTAEVRQPGEAVILAFSALAPNADFAATGRESSMVSVFVDGAYQSDVAVLAERSGQYQVNLAGLLPGEHTVELRAATDISGPHAEPAQVSDVMVRRLHGIAAEIARHAPIIETRYDPELAPGQRPEASYSDIPLVMTPSVRPLPDGGRRIDYDLMFSNEDGGTPVTAIFRKFGRSTDYEPVYSVTLNPLGRRVTDSFQGPSHIPYEFRGERVGDRPVLRVSTRNNLFDSNLLHATPRWSESPTLYSDRRLTDRELMLLHPWTFSVMGKELVREEKVFPIVPSGSDGIGAGTATKDRVVDARRHLYFDPNDHARNTLEQARRVQLQLRDGTAVEVLAKRRSILPTMPNRPALGTAIPLPEGINPDVVIGVRNLVGRVFVLDGEYRPRMLLTL